MHAFLIALKAVMGLATLSWLAAALTFAGNWRAQGEIQQSYGFAGSVKGMVFTGRTAGRYFFVSRFGSTLNVQNLGTRTLNLTLVREGMNPDQLAVSPGVTKLKIDGGGPQFLTFLWDRAPEGVIISPTPSIEYGIFMASSLIAAAAAGVFIVCLLRQRETKPAILLTYLWFLFFGIYSRIYEGAPIPLTGDEPHYMVAAESLGHDSDINVKDNYDTRYYFAYYPMELERHSVASGDGEASSHYPLLPLLLRSAFLDRTLKAQIDHYVTAKLLMVGIAALTAALVSLWAFYVSKHLISLFWAVLCMVSLPFLAYSTQLFPETVAALLLLVIFMYCAPGRMPPTLRRSLAFGAAFCAALLPFLHLKFVPAAVVGGAWVLLVTWRKNKTDAATQTMILISSALALSVFSLAVFGNPLGPYTPTAAAHFETLPQRYLTYLFDQDRGLFALNAALLPAVPGFVLLAREWKTGDVIAGAALILVSHIPNLLHQNWLLGSCPAGRYWVAVVPILTFIASRTVGQFFEHRPLRGLWRAGGTGVLSLLAGAALLTAIVFWKDQEAFYLPIKKSGVLQRYVEQAIRWE